MNYIQLDFEVDNIEQSDQLIALLSEKGFHGFEEEEGRLTAFIAEKNFHEESIAQIADFFESLIFTQSIVADRNWNEQWESSFEPVLVDDRIAIRANFHPSISTAEYEIIITPKMSFGTGHHATTYLMVQQMARIDFSGKSVFDFGTGTGILAILAEKLGAGKVLAIDNDEWSIVNAHENIAANHCSNIVLATSDSIDVQEKFDVVLANINRHVLINHLPEISNCSKSGAVVLLSGFFSTDKEEMFTAMKNVEISCEEIYYREQWLCIRGRKN